MGEAAAAPSLVFDMAAKERHKDCGFVRECLLEVSPTLNIFCLKDKIFNMFPPVLNFKIVKHTGKGRTG